MILLLDLCQYVIVDATSLEVSCVSSTPSPHDGRYIQSVFASIFQYPVVAYVFKMYCDSYYTVARARLGKMENLLSEDQSSLPGFRETLVDETYKFVARRSQIVQIWQNNQGRITELPKGAIENDKC